MDVLDFFNKLKELNPEKIQEVFASKDNKIQELCEIKGKLLNDNSILTDELADASNRVSLQQDAINRFKLDIESYETRQSQLESTNETLRERIAELETSIRKIVQAAAKAETREKRLREDLDHEREQRKDAVNKAEGDLVDVQKSLSNQRANYSTLSGKYERLEKENEKLKTELVVARAGISTTSAISAPLAYNKANISKSKPSPLSPSRKQASIIQPETYSHPTLLNIYKDLKKRYDDLVSVHQHDLIMWKEYKLKSDTMHDRQRTKIHAAKLRKKTLRRQSSKENETSQNLRDVFGPGSNENVDEAAADAGNEAEVVSPADASTKVSPHQRNEINNNVDAPQRPSVLRAPALNHLTIKAGPSNEPTNADITPRKRTADAASDAPATLSKSRAQATSSAAPVMTTPKIPKTNGFAHVSPWLGGTSERKANKPWKRMDSFEEEVYGPRKSRQSDATTPAATPALVRDRGGQSSAPMSAKRKAETAPADAPNAKRRVDVTYDMADPRTQAQHKRALEKARELESMTIGKEVYRGYRSRSKAEKAAETTEEENRPIGELYEINPYANDGRDYAYHDVVRKKDERKRLKATDCEGCRGWWADRSYYPKPQGPIWKDPVPGQQEQEEQERLCNPCMDTSRHRERFARAETPPEYWAIGFPNTPLVEEINERADQQEAVKAKKIRREAEKENGQWRRKK